MLSTTHRHWIFECVKFTGDKPLSKRQKDVYLQARCHVGSVPWVHPTFLDIAGIDTMMDRIGVYHLINVTLWC